MTYDYSFVGATETSSSSSYVDVTGKTIIVIYIKRLIKLKFQLHKKKDGDN